LEEVRAFHPSEKGLSAAALELALQKRVGQAEAVSAG